MKESTKTSRIAGIIEKIFRDLNAEFFGGELEEPIFTFSATKGAYGHITINRTWIVKTEDRREININPEYLQRPIEEVIGTLIHELTHLYCMQKGIKDTSNGCTYHNQKFKANAEKDGLIVVTKPDHMQYIGYSHTEPTEKLIQWIIDHGYTDFMTSKQTAPGIGGIWIGGGNGGTITPITPKTSSTRKYICPKCGNSFRATKDINVLCMDCMEPFIKA